MSLDGAITNLASWAGNTMMPTMAGMFFAGAVYRYSKGGPFEQLLYGGFASLMCSGMLRALEGFVQNAGATNADGVLDGDDESGELDGQRDPAHVRADPACGDGAAHGRSGFGDLSRLDLDQEVCRGDRRVDGLRHGAPGRIDGHAGARNRRVSA